MSFGRDVRETAVTGRANRGRRIAAWLQPVPAIFMLAWGGNQFTPLLHLYEQLGDYAPWQANLLLGTYVAGLVPGLLIASTLSDRHGRKPLLVVGVASAMIGSVLLAAGLHVFAVLAIGRAFAGFGVGIAMAVGTSWIKELSAPPFDERADASAGARRPSLAITLGFGIGAGVAGALAQWAPAPSVTPYSVHIVLSLLTLWPLLAAPESLPASARQVTGPWWDDLRIPSAGHRTFMRVIAPTAPWIFGGLAVAYAIMPAVVSHRLGEFATLYATVLTMLALLIGAVVQQFVPRLERVLGRHTIALGLAIIVLGVALASLAAIIGDPFFALGVAALIGVGFGVCMVSGLQTVQRIATPNDLAGLTGLFSSLAYSGFLLPAILSALTPLLAYPVSLGVLALIGVVCLVAVVAGLRNRR